MDLATLMGNTMKFISSLGIQVLLPPYCYHTGLNLRPETPHCAARGPYPRCRLYCP